MGQMLIFSRNGDLWEIIPEASFTALRDLVAAASQEQLGQLLAKL